MGRLLVNITSWDCISYVFADKLGQHNDSWLPLRSQMDLRRPRHRALATETHGGGPPLAPALPEPTAAPSLEEALIAIELARRAYTLPTGICGWYNNVLCKLLRLCPRSLPCFRRSLVLGA